MVYELRPSEPMRVFKPISPGHKLLCKNDTALFQGDVVKIAGVAVMNFDHKTKLALRLAEDPGNLAYYVLIEELCGPAHDLAHAWSYAYEDLIVGEDDPVLAQAANTKLAEICKELTPILRRHVRQKLRVVGVEEPEAPVADEDNARYVLPTL